MLRPTERRRVLGLSVALLTLTFCGLDLRSTSKWWFEDDPHHYAAAAAVDNPVDSFLDPNVLHRWGTDRSFCFSECWPRVSSRPTPRLRRCC